MKIIRNCAKKYRETHRELLREKQSLYYRTHKKQYKKYNKKYYKENFERLLKENSAYKKKYLLENPWIKSFNSVRDRVSGNGLLDKRYYLEKGIKNKLTIKDIQILWFRDKAYAMKKPHIHRIDSDDHYSMTNCIFLEAKDHYMIHRIKIG